MNSENVMRAVDLAPRDKGVLIVGTHRRFAAFLALVFPMIFIFALILGTWRNGFFSMFDHTMLKITLFPAIIAGFIWINRYWKPAIYAFTIKGSPVEVYSNRVLFFGSSIPLDHDPIIYLDNKYLYLKTNDETIFSQKYFFVCSKILNANVLRASPMNYDA